MQNFRWSMPNVSVYVPKNDLYFYLFHLSHTSQINCHILHKTWCCNIFVLCSYSKKLSSILTSFNRVFLQSILFHRENSSHTYFFKKGKFSDVTYVRLFKIATMITWKTLDFTLLILFFWRILFDTFNITFHIWYLKYKFWSGFPSKTSFWLSHTSHENGSNNSILFQRL